MADPGPQLQKVLDFRKSLEESRQVLSHRFANEAEFKGGPSPASVRQGGVAAANVPLDKLLLPLAVLAEVRKEREKAEKEQALVGAERGLSPWRHLMNNELGHPRCCQRKKTQPNG